jgi:Ulp1 family protease
MEKMSQNSRHSGHHPDTLVCSYHDADIYYRDLDLFQPGQWLNDACINICLRLLEYQDSHSDSGTRSQILLLDPAVASFIRLQCRDNDEFQEVYAGNQLVSKDYVFVPINDNQSFVTSSSHWSLLVMHVPSSQFWHFDSHGSHNTESAKAFAQFLVHCCRVSNHPAYTTESAKLTFKNVRCSHQQNGYDCGVYVLMNTELLFRYLITGSSSATGGLLKIEEWIENQCSCGWEGTSDIYASRYRMEKRQEIEQLRGT